MQACLDLVLPYVHERKQFGQPIGEFQLMQAKLADMYVDDERGARPMSMRWRAACDRGQTTREDAAGAILFAAERATWMALEAIQCLGGNGYINDYPAGRLLRDAKLYEIGAGTSEIRRMLIGREIFEKTRSSGSPAQPPVVLQHRVEQHLRAGGAFLEGRALALVVADAAEAGDEDHRRRRDAGDVGGVVAGAGDHVARSDSRPARRPCGRRRSARGRTPPPANPRSASRRTPASAAP